MTTTDTAPSTIEATSKAVEEARKALADRRATLEEASKKLINAKQCAADVTAQAGDASPSTFTKAKNALDYWESVVPNRERQVAAAECEVARATAEYVTAQVAEDASDRWGLGRYHAAKTRLIEAVREASGILMEHNDGRAKAMEDLLEAGLSESDADPLAPAWARPRRLNEVSELQVGGETIPLFDIRGSIIQAVDEALKETAE